MVKILIHMMTMTTSMIIKQNEPLPTLVCHRQFLFIISNLVFQSNLYLSRGYDTSTYALTSSSSPQSRHSPAVKYFGIARRFTDGIRNALWHSTPHFLSSLNNSTMPNTRRSLPKKMDSENASAFSGRLEDSQVRKIFACVKEGRVPTEDIAFNIIKMTDKKPMLSPPSFEFEGECIMRSHHSSHYVLFSRIYRQVII